MGGANDPTRVDTVSTGLAEYSDGRQSTPLHVRIVYDRQGGLETREAEVKCTISRDGVVVAVM